MIKFIDILLEKSDPKTGTGKSLRGRIGVYIRMKNDPDYQELLNVLKSLKNK